MVRNVTLIARSRGRASPHCPLCSGLRTTGGNWQSGRPPLWKAVLQSAHLETAYAKLCDRFVGQRALRGARILSTL